MRFAPRPSQFAYFQTAARVLAVHMHPLLAIFTRVPMHVMTRWTFCEVIETKSRCRQNGEAALRTTGRTMRSNWYCRANERRRPAKTGAARASAYWFGTPIATGRTGEPEPPCERSGKIIVQDTHTLSFASAPRLAFWIW